MRPTQYIVTIACGVTKEYCADCADHRLVFAAIAVLDLYDHSSLISLIKLCLRLQYYRERKSLSTKLKKAIDPIEKKSEGYYI
jgi:hypothetical protein